MISTTNYARRVQQDSRPRLLEQPGARNEEQVPITTPATIVPSAIRQPASPPILLRPRDAAAALGLHVSTVYELLAQGALPVVRIGRAVRVNRAALERWADERTEPQPAPAIRGRR